MQFADAADCGSNDRRTSNHHQSGHHGRGRPYNGRRRHSTTTPTVPNSDPAEEVPTTESTPIEVVDPAPGADPAVPEADVVPAPVAVADPAAE